MSAARMQLCFGAWIIALTAVFYALPQLHMYAWAAIGFPAAVAVLAGVRKHRPSRRLPWYLLSAMIAFFTAGDTAYNVLTEFLGQDHPFPSVADLFYLTAYPLQAIALLIFIRARSATGNRAALLDALVPTAGLSLLSWVFLIAPYVHDDQLGLLAKLTSVGYPLGDLLALAMVARLITVGGRRSVTLHLLVAGVVGQLVADAVYGLGQVAGTFQVGGPSDSGWIIFYASTALAALHPSMRDMTTGDVAPGVAGGRRIAVMSLAALIAPVVLLVEDLRGTVGDAPMIAAASGGIFLLVMARVAGLMKAQRETAARERLLRIAGADLVAATTEKEAGEAVRKAVAGLVPSGRPYVFHLLGEDAPGAPSGMGPTRRVSVEDQTSIFAPHRAALYAELVSSGRRKMAYLAADEDLLLVLEQSFHALMAQGIMAVERITMTAEVNRRDSEDYFRALIQSASDVIMIVGDDETIRYASPSALPVFGRTDLAGTSLYRLIAGTDHNDLRHLLDEVRAGRGVRDGVDLTAVSGDDLLLQVECTCRDLRDETAVGGLVVTIRDVTERRRLESDLAHQAYHDALTGLANRALFQSRLEQATATTAVLFVDLDDFKEVNDSLGHAAGDQLLITVARRIAEVVGPLNVVARTGGDEFAVLIEHVADGEPEAVAERIVAALGAPFEVSDGAGGTHMVSGAASVGIATSAESGGISELLRRADLAMYMAKTEGKNTWQSYQDELHEAMVRRMELRAALNEAVPGNQMRLRFQSIVDLPTGDVVGMEALVRWEHPHRGLLGPNEFIDLSEENGAVVAIGGWVLREALHMFTSLRRDHDHLRYVSVNVSARQFRTAGFVDQVRAVLAETGSRPEWLLLEITESLVLHDADQVWRDLGELRAMGIRIAIDDFGTGYSSLSYLSQMPVDVLKIDKSFIDDILANPQQMALVDTIVRLARTLDLTVVAEGIELDEHRAALVEMGCHFGQGYLFSKPVSPEEFLISTRGLS
ncbi:EAL domain-containing protein [Actinoplanes sp. TBRC 11911]|uniref:putative bifunctional diguanylate cyclase/phosphodiesterase n=1 Tax=Actinoplanes sp. TBRC 11911 TaxID=2729386 RepID=UPI00145EF415|nr:EAL domain-containing protein [Actinoplanes sp. TBRC 11911]NMO55114.1 EAL domain-containing protein [Actinoplanes sp. TBRC 11911]